jgi:hypothetical protein
MRTRERARRAAQHSQGRAPRRTPPQQPRLAATATPPTAHCTPKSFASLCALCAFAARSPAALAPAMRLTTRTLETRRLRVRDAGRVRRLHPRSQILKRANFISPSRPGMARTRKRTRRAAQHSQARAPRRTPPQQPRLAATETPSGAHRKPQNPWRVLASFLAPWRQKHSTPSPRNATRYANTSSLTVTPTPESRTAPPISFASLCALCAFAARSHPALAPRPATRYANTSSLAASEIATIAGFLSLRSTEIA